MALRRGALTFTRFSVQGRPPRDLRKRYLDVVRLRKFRPLEIDDEASEAVGWCVLERPFDLDFEPDKIFYDRFVLLGLRVDKWRIPGALLRAQVNDEEQRLLSRAGRDRLTRAEREEIKTRVLTRLRRKIPPVSRAFDVCWDLDAGTVLLFTHSARVITEFSALFEQSFGFEPVQDSPYTAAQRLGLPRALVARLDRVEPTSFGQGRKQLGVSDDAGASKPARAAARVAKDETASDGEPDGSQEGTESDEDAVSRVESTRFLGTELLLWIWLRAELVSEQLSLGALGEGEAWLERKLLFEHILDNKERVAVRGVMPTGSSEAREAVRNLKMPVNSRISLRLGDQEMAWDLQGPKFSIGSAALASALDEGEGDDAFLGRMASIEQLLETSDALYGAFLRERLAPLWEEAWQPAIVAWADGGAVPTAALRALSFQTKPSRRKRAG